MQHRNDIEGLRAVAILLVVAAHAGMPGFTGGFVGVDVFFVLSGYLITGLLLTEHARDGRIDFRAFYARRFRRLLPALAAMLLVTSWLGAQLLPSHAQIQHAQDGITAALWLSNVHFALSEVDYFSAHTSLYLHTWSLGVEEQFYLIWPALLALSLQAHRNVTSSLLSLLAIVTVISFLACVWLSWTSAMMAFYLMPMRAWQFALGSLVFLYIQRNGSADRMSGSSAPATHLSPPAMITAPIGMALIFAAAISLDEHDRYPGFWAIFPTLGTCFVLMVPSCTTRPGIVIAGLSSSPMQWLGRMSYGWYLWHWPLLILGGSVFDMTSTWTRSGLMVLALLAAWLSYHLIEQPIRRPRSWPLSSMKTLLLGAFVTILVGVVLLRWQESAMSAPAESGANWRGQTPKIYSMGCDSWYEDANLVPCVFEPDSSTVRTTVAVIGDSIGLQWFPAFFKLAEQHQWRLIIVTKSACPMVDEPIYYQRIGRTYTECSQWRASALDYLTKLQPDAIVMGSSQHYDFSPDQWLHGSQRILKVLSEASRQVAIMRATPVLPVAGETCVATSTPLRDWLIRSTRCTSDAHNEKDETIANQLIHAARSFSNVAFIDMNNVVCPNGTCTAVVDGILAYRDTHHLSAEYVEAMASMLKKNIELFMPDLFVVPPTSPTPSR